MAGPTLLEIDATQQTLEITSSRDAVSIQGRSIETGTPTDGEVLTYSSSASEWVYQSVDENVDDRVAALIQDSAGGGLTWTYDDSAGTLTPAYVGDSTLVTSGALSSGSISSGFGAIDIGSSALTAGAGSFTTLGATDDVTLAATKKLYLDGGNNTFISESAADTIMLTTGGTDRWKVNASGHLYTEADNNYDIGAASANRPRDVFVAGTITGDLTGDVTGNVSGSSGSTTGNAATATALATARAINGTDFDGTAAITVTAAAGTLTGTALKSTVVTSSLTAVGTITSGTWQGTTVAVNQGGTGATSLTDGGVLLGSGTGAITATSVLGDGEILIGDASGDPATLDVGSSTAITILGTVATGVWNGTAIANANLANSTVSYGGVSLALGASDSTPAFNLSDATAYTGDSSLVTVGTIASGTWNGTAITGAYIDATSSPLANTKIWIGSASNVAAEFALSGDATMTAGGAVTVSTAAACTGNAATATALQTARTIGGTSFDGTANIAVALSATTTALASARTIGGTSFDGTANIAVALSATATALATARAINGVDFDGTAAITVTAAAGTLTGATLNSGVTASSLTSVGTLTSVGVTGVSSLGNRIDHYGGGTGGTLAAQYGSGNDIGLNTSGALADFNIKAVGEFAVSAGASATTCFLIAGTAASVTGTLAVSSTLSATDITASGDVIIGTNPSSAGDIRLNKNFGIFTRNNANDANKVIVSENTFTGNDTLDFGDNGQWAAMRFHVSTLNVMELTSSAINLNKAVTANNAAFKLTGLVTSDPGVAGQLWNDSNTVKISAG